MSYQNIETHFFTIFSVQQRDIRIEKWPDLRDEKWADCETTVSRWWFRLRHLKFPSHQKFRPLRAPEGAHLDNQISRGRAGNIKVGRNGKYWVVSNVFPILDLK